VLRVARRARAASREITPVGRCGASGYTREYVAQIRDGKVKATKEE